MKKTSVDSAEIEPSPASVKRRLSDPLETAKLVVCHYELDEGESTAFGLHAHSNQEEVFIVQSGELTIEMEDGRTTAAEGEVIATTSGEYHQAVNAGSERVRVLVVAAPPEPDEVDLRRECETCASTTRQRVESDEGGEVKLTVCTECGTETGRFE
jgi:mannose-6-phosphate isomerase-like protein (cupin superfamily)